jgi:ataxia telangiectasia mutated family protein
VTLAGIEDTYKITDQGLNAPKILTVLGSDGKRRRLLVKGKDDLRQDFIMELILGHVSQLLQNQSHRMRLRTYNVLPLTPAAGLIEWVENTTSFGGYLYGSINTAEYAKSAHGRHNPGDKSFYDVISLFKAANDDVKQDKLEVFRTVCKQFKPVFRHFVRVAFAKIPRTHTPL